MGTESFPGVKCGRGVLLTTHPLLVWRSWRVELYLYPHKACNGVRARLKRDGTRWRTGGKVKGKWTNGVGSQFTPALYLETWSIQHSYVIRTPRLLVVDWTDPPHWFNWTLDSSGSLKDQIWFLRVCHHVSNTVSFTFTFYFTDIIQITVCGPAWWWRVLLLRVFLWWAWQLKEVWYPSTGNM
jgi:hypothetical protein